MTPPPFQPSRVLAALAGPASPEADAAAAGFAPRLRPVTDACCEPPVPPPAGASTAGRRRRLGDLDPHLHCSLIGTCLGTAELRRLVPRHADVDGQQASDLEIHHAAVELAVRGGPGAKALGKLLDERHGAAVRRFAEADDERSLAALWDAALHGGDVPGAYWALMTHRAATPALRQRAFGDVHMLSHRVGAANRADIRRLVALERDNAELKERLGRQQQRLREVSAEREDVVARLNGTLVEMAARLQRQSGAGGDAPIAELARLRHGLCEREEQVALQTSRREQAEQAAAVAAEKAGRLAAERDRALSLAGMLHAELQALERQIASSERADSGRDALAAWTGRRVLYVGGRPSSSATIRALCERAGVQLQVHDGGIEDRKGLLPAAVPGSDLVLLPVDCVDHDSMNRLKKLCARHGVPFRPLRTAGIASVVAALSEPVDSAAPRRGPAGPACPRHA